MTRKVLACRRITTNLILAWNRMALKGGTGFEFRFISEWFGRACIHFWRNLARFHIQPARWRHNS